MFCLLIVTSLLASVLSQEKYTTKYDDIDLKSILSNERLLRNYVDCLLDKGKCTPDGGELKKIIPDALENDCAKCNDKQKDGSKIVLHHIIENKKDWWNEIVSKYDPEMKYRKKYEELSKKEGLSL